MDKNKQQAQELLERYKQGLCTPEEIRLLQTTLLEFTESGQVPDPAILQESSKRVLQQLNPLKKGLPKRYYITAAIFIFALATALYFYQSNKTVTRKSKLVNEIGPGGNRATLTLADGTKVELDSAQRRIIVNTEAITYDNGRKVEGLRPKVEGEEVRHLVLSTPKGGQYQIILEDGTKVWLNAASTLKYPSRFSGNKREVEISGEAFFDVAQIKDQPFKVKSKGQEIDVIGTSFNISSYVGEESVRTTLVTGAIQVASHAGPYALKPTPYTSNLAPGEQSILQNNGELTKSKADLTSVLAWRNNKFAFDGKPFDQIMREVARWYNITVRYEGSIPTAKFTGDLNRNSNLATVQGILEISGIHYRLAGRTLIIQGKEAKP